MGIDSRNLSPALQRATIWAKDFDYILAEGTPNTLVGTVTAGVVRREVSSLAAIGALMNTDGDTVTTTWTLPGDADPAKDIYVRVLWTSGSQTSADTVLWKVFYKLVSLDNDALSASITTALNTVIATDTVGSSTAYVVRRTSWGVINGASITNVGCILQLLLEMDTKAVGLAEDLYALGIEFAYHRLVKKGGLGPTLTAPTA